MLIYFGCSQISESVRNDMITCTNRSTYPWPLVCVVVLGVDKNKSHVLAEFKGWLIVAPEQVLLHSAQIHGCVNYLVVVRMLQLVNRHPVSTQHNSSCSSSLNSSETGMLKNMYKNRRHKLCFMKTENFNCNHKLQWVSLKTAVHSWKSQCTEHQTITRVMPSCQSKQG